MLTNSVHICEAELNDVKMLQQLPTEILFKIFENLDLITLIELCKIKSLKEISKNIRKKNIKILQKILQSKLKQKTIKMVGILDPNGIQSLDDNYITIRIENEFVYHYIDYFYYDKRRIIQLDIYI